MPATRYAPSLEVPLRAYVPGKTERPAEHPPLPVTPLDPSNPLCCPNYLEGIDLFNLGYYWEAHEKWEAIWHLARVSDPRTGRLLRGLIQLAAALLKQKMKDLEGERKLIRSSLSLIEQFLEGDKPFAAVQVSEIVARMRASLAPFSIELKR